MFRMLASVQFDNKSAIQANEIDNEFSQRRLSCEAIAAKKSET